MEHFKKRGPLEAQLGRMMRSMAFPGMVLLADGWAAAVDLYETEETLVAVLDISGVDPEKLSVVAEDTRLVIRGERGCPVPEGVRYVHRLELGYFEKNIALPKPIDVAATTSRHRHGFLTIVMPKLKNRGRVRITVR